jgi:spore germination protein KA
MLAGGLWGLYGINILGIIVLIKIFSTSEFGIPYTAPLSPFSFRAMRDTIFRNSWRELAEKNADVSEFKQR